MSMSKERLVRRKLGDRRGRPRYDIVGDLWGTIETVLRLPLRNLGRGGALIESRIPLPVSSVQRLIVELDGEEWTTDVRVRHATPAGAGGDSHYLIGIEFLSAAPTLLERINRFLIEGGGEVAAAETT
jgi:hypothetical protein